LVIYITFDWLRDDLTTSLCALLTDNTSAAHLLLFSPRLLLLLIALRALFARRSRRRAIPALASEGGVVPPKLADAIAPLPPRKFCGTLIGMGPANAVSAWP